VKFIDEVVITAQSGDGGRGCVSFRREKFIPKGGPDGGDGGKGGDVVFKTTSRKRTLYQFRHARHLKAKNGMPGMGKRRAGKNGADYSAEIPPGTLITDADSGQILHDFNSPGQHVVLLKGGRGGRGNHRFKSSTNRAPRYAQPGEPGETRTLKLELKLLADVGIVGLPNAGKSTLIARISSARPKIADYPFTTLIPNLGVVKTGWGEPFVVADIPGLVEGAHSGTGLGIRFLKHIERTRILIHLVDGAAIDAAQPLVSYETIRTELSSYDGELVRKPQIVVLNKMDLPDCKENAARFREALGDLKVVTISAATGQGVDQLMSEIQRLMDREDENQQS